MFDVAGLSEAQLKAELANRSSALDQTTRDTNAVRLALLPAQLAGVFDRFAQLQNFVVEFFPGEDVGGTIVEMRWAGVAQDQQDQLSQQHDGDVHDMVDEIGFDFLNRNFGDLFVVSRNGIAAQTL